MLVNKLKSRLQIWMTALALKNKRRSHPDALGGGTTSEAVITVALTNEFIWMF